MVTRRGFPFFFFFFLLFFFYRLAEKVMIPDKETRETKIEGERHRAKRGNQRGESRCICNFAVDRACVLCWRSVAWTAECKMRKNRSLEKGDRIETRSGKKLNPRDSIGALYALLCHGQFLPNYSQRGYEKSRTRVRQPNGRRCWRDLRSNIGCLDA